MNYHFQNFYFREADLNHIAQIQIVRNAVNENRLSNPNLVTDEAVEEYLTKRGILKNDEIRFEMSLEQWEKDNSDQITVNSYGC